MTSHILTTKTADITMTPHDQVLPPIITLDASSPELGTSPTSPMPTPTKTRVLYCRKCEGHGEKVILKNHAPSCPYILCTCRSCEKLNYKRLKSFNKRNKEKLELAAALNAQRRAESGEITEEVTHLHMFVRRRHSWKDV
ncbi:hypothetical protein Y032_0296g1710 [Ancylostoma ceylanicum]|uniref:DM domain-containing protein n=1 Tax=Ancylostoma ceylanicum TaxID=53326 RepID=A0A016S4J9_9BILA|nr:hypothetical protein Y032_0296g1710 [Ancylostoma ceylanicum]